MKVHHPSIVTLREYSLQIDSGRLLEICSANAAGVSSGRNITVQYSWIVQNFRHFAVRNVNAKFCRNKSGTENKFGTENESEIFSLSRMSEINCVCICIINSLWYGRDMRRPTVPVPREFAH
jgi:hypothetical protein